MKSRRDPRALEHGPVFSWHRTQDGWIYTSGHAAVDVDDLSIKPGDFRHECRLTLENLRRTLERAGSSMTKVLKVTAYITDMNDFPTFNQIYAEFFPGETPPARTCVEVRRLPYNFKVEIEAVAHV
ncbi:MAG: RidA family protein [Nannocystaceae bacterium]|jgi:2-iminobutanoate/2-iminopropanoate deaminase|nr:RidA family protein [Nannocystaceae bacterium]